MHRIVTGDEKFAMHSIKYPNLAKLYVETCNWQIFYVKYSMICDETLRMCI